MSIVDDSAANVRRLFAKDFELFKPEEVVADVLVEFIHFCNTTRGVSFERCLQVARSEAAREVQLAAIEAQ